MLASCVTEDGSPVLPLEARLASPPSSVRSSKSVILQVRSTLLSMVKHSKSDDKKVGEIVESDSTGLTDFENSRFNSSDQRTIDAFLERLKTFSVSNWMGKPLCLSPPLLAQYGWQCIGVDTIKCCSCSAVISVCLPWPSAENYRIKCYNYRKKILSSHMKICSWPSYPCSNSFVTPFYNGVQDSAEILEEYGKRKKNLLLLGPKLPRLENSLPSELNITKEDLIALAGIQNSNDCCDGTMDESENLSLLETASILAMCGWDVENSASRTPGLFCLSTCRTVKLHNFFAIGETVVKSSSGSEEIEEKTSGTPIINEDSDLPSKRQKLGETSASNSHSALNIVKKYFHPLQQHCPWSHWIVVLKPISNQEFQNHGTDEETAQYVLNPTLKESKPGWEIVMHVLLGRKAIGEKSTRLGFEDANQAIGNADAGKVGFTTEAGTGKDSLKSSPEKAVKDFRQLMKELSSPK